MYHVVPMSEAYAREIACWQYPGAYAIYSLQPSEELLAELLDGSYYACLDGAGTLMGYFCFGQSARIPLSQEQQALYQQDCLDFGLGMEPRRCGKGEGTAFMQAGLAFAAKTFPPRQLRWWPPLINGRFTCIKSLALSARHRSPTCAPASRLS